MRQPFTAVCLCICLASGFCSTAIAGDEARKPIVLELWPGTPPGETGKTEPEKVTVGQNDKTIKGITNVSKPTLSVYPAPSGSNTGVAVVVCPGGGYRMLAWDHEGEQVATWLNSIGITAAILKYRVPKRPGTAANEPPVQALMDAQRAVSMVRGRAGEWGADPKKIGLLGFSAGGHLTAWVSTNFDKRSYEPIDALDKQSTRPDFAVMIYPGGVIKRGTGEIAPEIKVSSQTPPSFFVHAGDDPGNAENSIQLYLALKRAGVPSELHIYASGGHGFGLRPSKKPANSWPARCEAWLRDSGVLPADSKTP